MQKSNLLQLFEDLLGAAAGSDEQIALLERIQIGLSNISSSAEFEQVHPDVPWSHLFYLIHSNDNEEVERLLGIILEHFINNLSIEHIMTNFAALLQTGLDQQTSLSQRGKLLCLKAFEKLARCSTKDCFVIIKNVFQHHQINALLHLFLDSDEQALWLKSKEILEQLIRTASRTDDPAMLQRYLSEEYFHPVNREILLSANSRNEIVRLRLYEYLIDLCLVEQRVYQHITEEQHLLDQFLHDCTHHDDDVLYLMNCLELLTSLTQKLHTLAYLQNKTNVIEHFFRLLSANDGNDLIKPGLIRFFGSYLRNYLLLLESMPTNADQQQLLDRFLPFLFEILLQGDSNTYAAIGLDTIGFIGRTLHGKEFMLSNGKFADFIGKLIQMIRSSQSDTRTRSLLCLADLFHLSNKDCSSETAWALTEQIYRLCNRVFSIIPILVQIAKQPFVDLRLAAYRCLLELTRSRWALQAIHAEPGFLEFLLNRSTEKDKQGKEVKFAIIQSICQAADEAKSVLGNVNFLKLRRYVNEGAFFVEPEANVAFDGSNE